MALDASILAKQDALARRALSDEQAFAELYHLLMNEVYGFVIKRVGHRETAEDLVADIFRKVFCHLANFAPEKGHFRTWMYRIATNTLIDHYRVHHHPDKPAPIDLHEAHNMQSAENIVAVLEKKDDHDMMRRHLDGLPPKQRMMVTLRYFDEYSNKEIAEFLGMSETHVAVTLHRALRRLRHTLTTG